MRHARRDHHTQHPSVDATIVSRTADDAAVDESRIVPDVDGYEIIARLGEGGMGTVWQAVQLSTRREVALKLMAAPATGSAKARQRFEREVELASSLEHPNIAAVYDSGLMRGVYFYAMRLIVGAPLDQYVHGYQLDDRAILRLFLTVCRAVEFAHNKGVIHRDLKPSNVMVSEEGEPFILDFGLAKAMLDDRQSPEISREGDVAGTLPYMSPEQAAGRIHEVDTRTDVYALGVILFRLLTGQHPYVLRGSAYEVSRRIIEAEPLRPRALRPDLGRDAEAVLLKCLEKSPDARYGAAGALAADIEKLLAGDPVSAQPATLFYLVGKRLRKHRVRTATAAALVMLFAALITFGFIREHALRKDEQAARTLADIRSREALHEAETARQINQFLRDMLASAGPGAGQGPDMKVAQFLDNASRELEQRFKDNPAIRAELHTTIGMAYRHLFLPPKALPHIEKALGLTEQVYGKDHPRAAECMLDVVLVLRQLHQFDRAYELLDRAEPILAAAPGYENMLAEVARQRGLIHVLKDRDKAMPEFRRALQIVQRAARPDRRLIANIHHDLSCEVLHAGDAAEAERLATRSVELHLDAHGEFHKETSHGLAHLARALAAQGKLDDAKQAYRRAAAIAREIHDYGWAYLNAQMGLAQLLEQTGPRDEAVEAYLDIMKHADRWPQQRQLASSRIDAIRRAAAAPDSHNDPGDTPGDTPADDPAAQRRGDRADLIDGLNLEHHRLLGNWTIVDNALTYQSERPELARIRLARNVGDEYQLDMNVEILTGARLIDLILTTQGKQFILVIDYYVNGKPHTGLEKLDGKGVADSAEVSHERVIVHRGKTALRIVVRRAGVSLWRDGKKVYEWRGDFDRLGMNHTWTLHDPAAIGIGTLGTGAVRFSDVTLTPLSD